MASPQRRHKASGTSACTSTWTRRRLERGEPRDERNGSGASAAASAPAGTVTTAWDVSSAAAVIRPAPSRASSSAAVRVAAIATAAATPRSAACCRHSAATCASCPNRRVNPRASITTTPGPAISTRGEAPRATAASASVDVAAATSAANITPASGARSGRAA